MTNKYNHSNKSTIITKQVDSNKTSELLKYYNNAVIYASRLSITMLQVWNKK